MLFRNRIGSRVMAVPAGFSVGPSPWGCESRGREIGEEGQRRKLKQDGGGERAQSEARCGADAFAPGGGLGDAGM